MPIVWNPFSNNFDFTGSGSGGSITGAGTTNQLSYWDSATSISGDTNFNLDTTLGTLNLGTGSDVAKHQVLTSHSLAAGAFTDSLVFTVPVADKFVLVEYSVERGSANLRVGTLLIANDGTNISVVDNYSELGSTQLSLASPGVVHTINGANLEIRATSTGGASGTLKKLSRRWA